MKQFDEWWESNSWKFTCRERSPDRIAREAWEAALRWSLAEPLKYVLKELFEEDK